MVRKVLYHVNFISLYKDISIRMLSKNDLPSMYTINNNKFYWYNDINYCDIVRYHCLHRNNDLSTSVYIDGFREYYKYNKYYRYNGYAHICDNEDKSNKFIKGINFKKLKYELNK